MKIVSSLTVPIILGLATIATAMTWRDIPFFKSWISEMNLDEQDTLADSLLPTVQLKNGTVRGQVRVSGLTTIYRYLGIPFAKAPVGELRFEPPQPHDGWGSEVFKATKHPNSCPQFHANFTKSDEDCLYLSVYTKRKSGQSGKLLPVIFFIHGGGYVFGQNSMYKGAKILKSDDVVLVTTQYRLGTFGFLSTGDDAVSANNGMKDMVQGLRWVQENIEAFGGDPSQVTIMGESAGSASVLYLLISPLARGLFNGVIAMSGTPLQEWAIDRTPWESAQRLAEPLGCPTVDSKALVACLRGLEWNKISEAGLGMIMEDFGKFRIELKGTTPTIEGNVPGAFLPADPLKLMQEGDLPDVPVMLGAVQHEGILPLAAGYYLILDKEGLVDDPEYMQDELLGDMLSTYNVNDRVDGASISQSLASGFLEPGTDRTNFTEMQYELLDMMSSVFMKAPVQRTADILSRRLSSVYLYSFEHYGKMLPFSSLYDLIGMIVKLIIPGNLPEMESGICHADDLLYIFDLVMAPVIPKDITFAKNFVELFTNFAVHGTPTPESTKDYPIWPRYDSRGQHYLRMTIPFEVKQYYPLSWKQGVLGAKSPKQA